MRGSSRIGRRAALVALALLPVLVVGCGEDPVEPTEVVAIDFHPTWSPVADSIAFIRTQATSEGPAGIYVVGSDGGTPRLVAAGEFHDLQYSPDGTKLATAVDANLITIVVANDTRTLLLTSATTTVIMPDWSPNGTRIVYSRGGGSSGPADSTGIHIFDLTTGVDAPMRDASGAAIQGFQPVWSPEDSLIAFYRDGAIDVWNTRTHATSRLITPPAGGTDNNPVWIEGGRRLLAAETTTGYRTVVVDVATKQVSSWMLYTGPLNAVAPRDSAFVFRDVDPTIASPPTYVLYRRGLTDVAGTTIRQLTHYRP